MTEGLGASARLALDTIRRKPVKGIPGWMLHVMEHEHIERLAGASPGDYVRNPEQTYLAMQRAIGACLLDQCLWDNPLTMGPRGFEGRDRGATTGAREVVCDGIVIDSPESVVQHLEEREFLKLEAAISAFDEDAAVEAVVRRERELQARIGPDILKTGYGFAGFPKLAYGAYGYVHYFSAYALYPEVMEKHFRLQADLALLNNRAAARAYTEATLPLLYRLDHDMADSRGLLVRPESLDVIWLPHFARCIEPLVRAGVTLIWHCDGNLMALVPRLLEAGVKGFQGFQYEDGMDYRAICRTKTRDGEELLILAGVSVTTTLPHGTPVDVRDELRFLVENGPRTGLILGASSSITPGVPWENLRTLVDGLKHYREHGRD